MLEGRRRVESDRFVALRTHYLFASQLTTPGLEGPRSEEGGVEGEVGRCRRNHLVPVPHVADLAELNALLLAGCGTDLQRRIDGRAGTVGEASASERPLLLTLPGPAGDAGGHPRLGHPQARARGSRATCARWTRRSSPTRRSDWLSARR